MYFIGSEIPNSPQDMPILAKVIDIPIISTKNGVGQQINQTMINYH